MSFIIYTFSCFVILGATTAQKVVFQNVSKDITDNIYLLFMNGSTVDDYVSIKLVDGLTLPTCVGFNVQRETVFHFHGWMEDPTNNQASTIALGTAFLQRNSSNLVFFDYSTLVQSDNYTGYPDSFINSSYIGSAIGQYFQQFIPAFQLINYIHCTSFSLGSQIMSKAARTFGSGQLPWLTGMDPAGPLYNLPTVEHLTSSDAVFVDVIHTDGGFFGDFRSVGTVDFFPNGGTRVQPACRPYSTNLYCSHHMSFVYYAASLLNPTAFPGKKCLRSFLCNPCTCSLYSGYYTFIGYNVDKKAQGNFYLDTSATSPYGLGMAGMNNYGF